MALILTLVFAVVGVAGVAGFGLLILNYRRQRDWEDPPGKVPEDYS